MKEQILQPKSQPPTQHANITSPHQFQSGQPPIISSANNHLFWNYNQVPMQMNNANNNSNILFGSSHNNLNNVQNS